MQPIVIAHRACPKNEAENSLAGIATAATLGADAVEIDIRRANDGTPMLLHDRWMLRTTGWPLRLEWISSQRAKRTRLFKGGRIPTFAEALEAAGPDLTIAIDVKDGGAGDAVVSEIRNQSAEDRVLFWSKKESNLAIAQRRAPDLEIALLRDTKTLEQRDQLFADVERLQANAISAHWSQVNLELRERCDAADIKLYAWCKKRSIDLDKLALLDGLVTDWPDLGAAAVKQLP